MRLLFSLLLLMSGVVQAADLSPADFTYLGASPLFQTGQSNLGLAHDPVADEWYTVQKAGNDPFVIVKFKLPPVIGQNCKILQTYPGLNVNNALGVTGWQLIGMKGLLWDGTRGGLWCSFGSFYANGANLPVLCFYKLPEQKLYGPWKVPAAVHSDTVKGCIINAPCELLRESNQAFCAFGVHGSTRQNQSFGAGLVSMARPDLSLPAMSELTCKRVIHWPMKTVFDPKTNTSYGYSDFPRDPADFGSYILGNNDVNLVNKWSYQANDFVPIKSFWQSDSICGMVEVRGSLMWFGYVSRGYGWYGNNVSHQDGTDAGTQWSNNIDSTIFPGQKIKGVATSRGGHAESYEPKWWMVSTAKVKAALLSGNQLLPYDLTGNTRTLGGNVVFGSAEVSNPHFDPETGLLRMFNTDSKYTSPFLHTWQVTK